MQTGRNQPQPSTAEDHIRSHADALCQRITHRLIQYMECFSACYFLIDYHPPCTLWDEICLQVQTGHSDYWGLYVGTMEIAMGQYLNELTAADQLAIWLQPQDAQDWQLRLLYFPEQLATKHPPIDRDDITSHLLHHYIYPAARRRPKHRTETNINTGQ